MWLCERTGWDGLGWRAGLLGGGDLEYLFEREGGQGD